MAVSAKYDEFNHWWATEGDWVEEPNYRRNGMSGVQCVERNGKKLYVKRMTHHLFHSVRYPFGRPTIVREVAVIKELEREIGRASCRERVSKSGGGGSCDKRDKVE